MAQDHEESTAARVTIRQRTTMSRVTREERHEVTLNSIRELEEMLERGDIEPHAYFTKKRALIRLL